MPFQIEYFPFFREPGNEQEITFPITEEELLIMKSIKTIRKCIATRDICSTCGKTLKFINIMEIHLEIAPIIIKDIDWYCDTCEVMDDIVIDAN